MKTAIVYDRANKWGGAERVVLSLLEIFPNAELFTSLHSREHAKWTHKFSIIHANNLSKIPYIRDKHELLGTFMPIIFENYNFDKFDLVLSVTSEAAKGIITKPGTLHICYCLTPTRYLWSHYGEYFNNPFLKLAAVPAVWYLKKWDIAAANRPDIMVAISSEVQKRIKNYYYRDSLVIHPPLTTLTQPPKKIMKSTFKKYFLVVARLVPYKRVDLVVDVFNEIGYPLYIVGRGSELARLKSRAGQNIAFYSDLTDAELAGYYEGARALVLAQEEDFGLVAIEAMSFGTPVVAYKAGGALDFIQEGINGVYFNKQDAKSLKKAILSLDSYNFDDRIIKSSVKKFSKKSFKKKFLRLLKGRGI